MRSGELKLITNFFYRNHIWNKRIIN